VGGAGGGGGVEGGGRAWLAMFGSGRRANGGGRKEMRAALAYGGCGSPAVLHVAGGGGFATL